MQFAVHPQGPRLRLEIDPFGKPVPSGFGGGEVAEYSPREIKQAIVGYGGAEKKQIQHMVRTLLEMDSIPQPDDAADALAIAICHLHSMPMRGLIEESS